MASSYCESVFLIDDIVNCEFSSAFEHNVFVICRLLLSMFPVATALPGPKDERTKSFFDDESTVNSKRTLQISLVWLIGYAMKKLLNSNQAALVELSP